MARIYYLDLPNINIPGEWVNYDTYSSKKEALKVLKENWGIGKDHSGLFISAGEDME